MSAKKTMLYDDHVKQGGKIVEYAGWLLPVTYTDLADEHHAVRKQAGIFDVSHMGEITVKGEDAEKFVDYLMTNDLSKIAQNQIMYSIMCYEDGTCVDDLLVYKYSNEHFYIVVNAANSDKDYEWITKQSKNFNVSLENNSPDVSQLAFQGPLAQEILQTITDYDLSTIKFFRFFDGVKIAGCNALVSRTGYTGEDGFEIYLKNEDASKVFNAILEAGKNKGVKPCGLGCRDTLRFEAGLPLYGHEISDEVNPLEGGLKFFVKLDKESDFIGKAELNKQYSEGLKRKLCGFELLGKGIPREGFEIEKDGEVIGYVTTGYLSPTLDKTIGNALVKAEYAVKEEIFDVKVRKRTVQAKVIDKRFLKNK